MPNTLMAKLPALVYFLGAAADAGAAIHDLSTRLANRLDRGERRADRFPAAVAVELGAVYLVNRLVGRKYPRLMYGVLMGLGGLHGAVALGTLKTIRDANQDAVLVRAAAPMTSFYFNPEFFR